MLLAIGSWLVPMVIATSAGGELLEYRNEILFHQTMTRYAEAWHHHEPVWYYFVEIIPLFWLPLIALLPWLWPRWRSALRERDTMLALLLAWVVMVVLFFTSSSGKRTLYILPAVPAFAMAAAPWLPELLRARGPRRVAFTLGCVLTAVAAVAAGWVAFDVERAGEIAADFGIRPVPLLALCALGGAASLFVFKVRDGWLAYAGVLGTILLVTGLGVYPRIDAVRSGRAFVERVERASAGIRELGLVGAKEQYLLELRRPSYNFGHARWRERENEAADAAAWLAAAPDRGLVVDSRARESCFSGTRAVDLGRANRQRWFLVTGQPDAACVAAGDLSSARLYTPPNASLNTDS
jgi:4-amino-4-deoxy-L-arabinose transferase-like glycosyltransferase